MSHSDFITIWYMTDIELQMDHHIKPQNYDIFLLL